MFAVPEHLAVPGWPVSLYSALVDPGYSAVFSLLAVLAPVGFECLSPLLFESVYFALVDFDLLDPVGQFESLAGPVVGHFVVQKQKWW